MLFSLFTSALSRRYAVLIAGSSGWENYRDQANIFTIYQQLIIRGFTADDITVFAYDDLAQSELNPFKGQVFHDLHHHNVYPGSSAITYKGNSVTANNFYNVLKNLPTTSSDNVFIYYCNHGGPGILGVPDGCGGYITSAGLSNALNEMSKGHFKYCFFEIDASYSSSVAIEINTPNVYIITSSSNKEASKPLIWDSALGTYLTNEFSYYFIEYIDEYLERTIDELYTALKTQTISTHVCHYGTLSMGSLPISDFFGKPNKVTPRNIKTRDLATPEEATENTFKHLIANNPDPIVRAKARIELLKRKERTEKLVAVLEEICKEVDIKNYEKHMNEKGGKITPEYYQILSYFTLRFGEISGDDLPKLCVLVSLAETLPKKAIIEAIDKVL